MSDAAAVYGSALMLYRDPASTLLMPEVEYDSTQPKSAIPQKPGFGIYSHKTGKSKPVPVELHPVIHNKPHVSSLPVHRLHAL